MPELSRSQVLVYGAVAVALLLLGARWMRSGERSASGGGEVSFAADQFTASEEGNRDVVVHVAGEVRRPGVYRLPAGARVADAVQRAGGVSGGGDRDAINLAAKLADGQQIVVPGKGPAGASAAAAGADGPISLGSATAEQLDTIEGIGPVTAQNILDYRDEHGGFSSVDEIDQVPGIGPATMETLRSRLQP